MREVSTYEQAEAYLLETIDETLSRRTSYKLDRMREFLRQLGDPHKSYATIHIGGTSGKGSTSTMIAAALQAAGRRTGLHTKPHLSSMTERARIDGRPIARDRFAEILGAMMPAIESTTASHGRPTYYETLLALTFLYFAQERVEVAVIEVGLGGRLDGTNVVEPLVAAITSVGYDHMEVLGTTIEEIAFEKAGIAKRGVPLVLANLPPAAREVVEGHAAEVGAPVIRVADVVRVTFEGSLSHQQMLAISGPRGSFQLRLAALGIFARANAATAIAVLEQLSADLRPSFQALANAFESLEIAGRMELVSRNPAILFDIAHNAEKAESLVASLRERFAGRRVHYVVAIGESKDARTILQIFADVPSTFTFTSFSVAGRRAIAPARLAAIAESLGTWGRAITDPVEALMVARRRAQIDDVVVVTGSTFVVAALRALYVPTPA
ncbi:MAG: bifunctional folylpolyglutamate synthase/dihydrofolate synthase [Candidatus Eremiobacteraeota bacterium]|nr:bifunctional folylpolyglutamate synthase/dihydrofolate synthase [Candidatus Eremiobacteraeota bacterium]